jgi:putative Holliday junction resolvase
MDGSRGIQAEKTAAFIESLSRHVEIPVTYRDERLSTIAARELVQGVRKTGRETRYDAAAAALILQGYLDDTAGRHPDFSPPPEE